MVFMNISNFNLKSISVHQKILTIAELSESFNPNTLIKYSLPQTEKVSVMIYNSAGKEIVTFENNIQNAGEYTLNWDASGLPGGIFLQNEWKKKFFQGYKNNST